MNEPNDARKERLDMNQLAYRLVRQATGEAGHDDEDQDDEEGSDEEPSSN